MEFVLSVYVLSLAVREFKGCSLHGHELCLKGTQIAREKGRRGQH